ncbi:MAG: AAA family ATPase [Deltaproteobacteria bacterium]|nr:AAA family ATPase [Deltaproteobacteria bacterium]
MYERFFYLTERPFHITPDPAFLYLSGGHREALDLMLYGITGKRGFVLLTGEVGTGKTTLCRALLERLPKKTGSALILNPILSERELLGTIVADFGITPADTTAKGHLEGLNGFLIKEAESGGNAAVIIDEAQLLGLGALEMLRVLSNLETEKEKLLQIILVGQPELDGRLKDAGLRQLNQRIAVRHRLAPLGPGDTHAYIQNRLFVAGGRGAVAFDEAASLAVYKGSAGVPRAINVICDRALTAAFTEEKRAIDAVIVRKAVEELRREGCLPQRAEPVYERYYAHLALMLLALAFMIAVVWGPKP